MERRIYTLGWFFSSQACQQMHWKSEHKVRCKEFQGSSTSVMMNLAQTEVTNRVFKASSAAVNRSTCTSSIALIPECGRGTSRTIKQPKSVRACFLLANVSY